MTADEIGAALASELKHVYQYRQGRWLYRQGNRWGYTSPPRLFIWLAMYARKRAGVVPSSALADDIQRSLEGCFNNQQAAMSRH
jgi:hypothetical protein